MPGSAHRPRAPRAAWWGWHLPRCGDEPPRCATGHPGTLMAPWHGTGHPGAAEALGGCPPRGSGRAGGCGSETSPQHPARWRRGCLRRMLPLIISELIGYSIISLAISSRIWEQPVFAAEAALGTGENKLARQSHLPVAFAAWLRRGARLPGGGEGTSPQPPGWHPPALGAHKGKGQSSWGGSSPLASPKFPPRGSGRGAGKGAGSQNREKQRGGRRLPRPPRSRRWPQRGCGSSCSSQFPQLSHRKGTGPCWEA